MDDCQLSYASVRTAAARCLGLTDGPHPQLVLSFTCPLSVTSCSRVSRNLAFLSATDGTTEAELIVKCRDGHLSPSDIDTLEGFVSAGLGEEPDTREPNGASLSPEPTPRVCIQTFPELERGVLYFHLTRVQLIGESTVLPLSRDPSCALPRSGERRTTASGNLTRPKNANRASVFVKWLVDTFTLPFLSSSECGVLDVAGGAGQVAFHVTCHYRCPCVIVDPRPAVCNAKQRAYFRRCCKDATHARGGMYRISVTPNMDSSHGGPLPEAASRILRAPHATAFVAAAREISSRNGVEWRVPLPQQLTMLFGVPEVTSSPLAPVWSRTSIVVGMHPDQATEPLIDACLAHSKPFAVVPCCVFPNDNPGRRGPAGEPVRTYEEFLDYLQAKDSRIRRAALPFAGRNVVLYALAASLS